MTAREVCELLVAAYERGTGCGESVDWSDLDTAYEAAVATLAEPVDRTGWTLREIAQEFVKDIEAAHGKGAPDLADEWPDLHATYDVAVRTLAETAPRESRLEEALRALLDWGRDHTRMTDENSPHELLVAAVEALDLSWTEYKP